MEDKDCICFMKNKCCHVHAPKPCHTPCMGIKNCDVYVTKADFDNKELVAILEATELYAKYRNAT